MSSTNQIDHYSFAQLESLWIQAGGSPAWAPVMAAVAIAESGGAPAAVNNGDINGGSYGLWQINGASAGVSSNKPPVNGGPMPPTSWVQQMLTPLENAKAAVALFNARGLEPWKGDAAVQSFGVLSPTSTPPSLQSALSWVTNYIKGTGSSYVSSILNGAQGTPPSSVPGQNESQTLNPSREGAVTPGNLPGDLAGLSPGFVIGSAVASGASGLAGLYDSLSHLLGDLTSVQWWKRVGLGVLGVGIFGVGLVIFLSQTKEGRELRSEAESAAPLAAMAAA